MRAVVQVRICGASLTTKNNSTTVSARPARIWPTVVTPDSTPETTPLLLPPPLAIAPSIVVTMLLKNSGSRPNGPLLAHSRKSSQPWRTVGPSSCNWVMKDGAIAANSPMKASRPPSTTITVAHRWLMFRSTSHCFTGMASVARMTAMASGRVTTSRRPMTDQNTTTPAPMTNSRQVHPAVRSSQTGTRRRSPGDRGAVGASSAIAGTFSLCGRPGWASRAQGRADGCPNVGAMVDHDSLPTALVSPASGMRASLRCVTGCVHSARCDGRLVAVVNPPVAVDSMWT